MRIVRNSVIIISEPTKFSFNWLVVMSVCLFVILFVPPQLQGEKYPNIKPKPYSLTLGCRIRMHCYSAVVLLQEGCWEPYSKYIE